MIDFDLLTDWVGTLALLTVLATGYGIIARIVSDEGITQVLAGAVFGLVTVLFMHAPLTIAEGVIIDMRNVPIVLAAAFLGPRGMLVTLAIAIATRLHIAGDGTGTGIAAMIFCTVVGFAWHLRTHRKQFRTRADYLRLGVLTCLSLWTVVLLPTPVAFAVLTQAAPVLLALYLVFVPLTGYLLDRELTMLRLETMQRGSSGIDLDTGLLSRKAFEREAEVLRASNGVVAVATIRVRHLSRLTRLWGTDKTGLALAALRARLRGVLSHADTVGRLREDTLAVPLTRAEFDRWDSLARTVDAALVDRPLDFGEGGLLGLRLDLSTRPLPGPDRPAAQPGTQPIRTTG